MTRALIQAPLHQNPRGQAYHRPHQEETLMTKGVEAKKVKFKCNT
jgi:hypothetical protein